jgi:hypothetical protein
MFVAALVFAFPQRESSINADARTLARRQNVEQALEVTLNHKS